MYGQGEGPTSFASAGIQGSSLTSPLMQMLDAPEIVPGVGPGYELCKIIYSYHPLGEVLTEAPIRRAQALPRTIAVPGLAESRLVERFQIVWDHLAKLGGTVLINRLMTQKRIYGIASLGVGERGRGDTAKPLDLKALSRLQPDDLYFNVFDPLNTAGSLVLNQDPNSPDFLKPSADGLRINGQGWHGSRAVTVSNGQPLYIDWTASAYGFVGRSVYQRALYPLKTFLRTMLTDDMVTKKAALLVTKMETPASFIDGLMQNFFGMKRAKLKEGVMGQVLQIGPDDSVETLNFTNLEGPYKLVRENVLRNIATACSMPASLIAQETMVEGMGEGTEDTKKEVEFLNFIRTDMQPAYDFLDVIAQHVAWTPDFYATLFDEYPEYREVPYETAFMGWKRAFKASWPNLMVEPDSEKAKAADVQMKAAIALAEVMIPEADPMTKARVIEWLASQANQHPELFSGKLVIDVDELEDYFEDARTMAKESASVAGEGGDKEPKEPRAFSAAS
jgi:hypothetical protein